MFPSKFISVLRIKELNITYMINDSERITEKLGDYVFAKTNGTLYIRGLFWYTREKRKMI